MITILLTLGVVALLVALLLFLVARRERERTGIPAAARIVYADTGAWERVERPLFSRHYGLTGKPDYVLEDDGKTIPVEVKPNRRSPSPRESDVMQLTAYGLLVEDAYGQAPPYGLLKYQETVFRIDFTPELREQLLTLVEAMRLDLASPAVARSHADGWKCRGCGYRQQCGQALEEGEEA